MGKLIDGKAVAAAVCEGLKSRVAALSAAGVVPCIALIKANHFEKQFFHCCFKIPAFSARER